MSRFSATYVLGLSVLGLLLFAPASLSGSPATDRFVSSSDDSTGARLLLEQQGQMLRVQGVFTNEDTAAGPLHYALAVQRTGSAGTSQSTQSGQFETAPGQTDTLSTVRLNVQPGDRMELHLTIRRDDTLVDEVRQQHTF